ncbi:MAG: hypothetical protein QG575_145, partial [Euryarchaeota archaeon]|nr:hypothetical protein [Euryarchaeota archaeon]
YLYSRIFIAGHLLGATLCFILGSPLLLETNMLILHIKRLLFDIIACLMIFLYKHAEYFKINDLKIELLNPVIYGQQDLRGKAHANSDIMGSDDRLAVLTSMPIVLLVLQP